jgi:muramidase (phage lysozyme)
MTRRKINQIQESLLEQYKVWRRGSGTDLPPLEGGGGFGLGGVTTSRMPTNVIGPKIPTSSKPRVSPEQARELGILKPQPKVWRRGESSVDDAKAERIKRAEAFLSGQGFKTQSEPSSISKPSMAPEPRTPQERLVAQAQLAQRGQGTAEPATVRDLIAAVPGLTKTKMAGVTLGGSLAGVGLGLKGAEMLSDPGPAEQERSKWLQKFDAGLEKSDQKRQEMQQRIDQDQKIADELTAKTRKQKPMKENKTTRTLLQIEQDLRNKLAEQTQSKSRQLAAPLFTAPKSQLREPSAAEKEIAGLLPGVGTAQDIQSMAGGDYSAAPYMALGLLPGGGLIKKGVKKLRQKFGKADDYDFASAVASRTPKKGDPVPGMPGQYYTGEMTAAGKPKTTSVAPTTKPPEPTVKAEPEAPPAAASKPATEPLSKKPFLQSKDEYLRGLSKDELERLELVKKMQRGDLLKKSLIGGAAVGLPYLAYKSGVPQMWYKGFQKDPARAVQHPIDTTIDVGTDEVIDWINTPVPGNTLPPEPKKDQKNESSNESRSLRDTQILLSEKYTNFLNENLLEKKELDYDELIRNSNVRVMLDLIARAEGNTNYDTLVGGGKFKDFSSHPNITVKINSRGKIIASDAAGRYQIMGSNWPSYSKRLGLKDFSPESQDKIAVAMLADRGALNSVLKGDFKTAVKKTGSQWTSLPATEVVQGYGPKNWKWVDSNLADLKKSYGLEDTTQVAQVDTPKAEPKRDAKAEAKPGYYAVGDSQAVGVAGYGGKQWDKTMARTGASILDPKQFKAHLANIERIPPGSVVAISGGGNDINSAKPEVIANQMNKLIAAAKARGLQVIHLLPTSTDNPRTQQSREALRQAMINNQTSAPIIDLGQASKKDPMNLHLDKKEYTRIAQNIADMLPLGSATAAEVPAKEKTSVAKTSGPETFVDKLNRVASGELVSQVFGDKKKTAAPAAPIVEPPKTPTTVSDKQPSKDSEPSFIEKLYGIDKAREVQAKLAADVAKQEQERKERSKTPKTQQSVSGIIEPNAAVTKNKEFQPLLTIEKEKREREQARKSNKPMQAPSFDPELDPKGWAEYEEYMQQRQIDAGDRFSREREARLAREKKAAEKSTQQDVSSLLQKDQAGIKSAYKGSAGAQAIMQQNPDVIKDINRIQTGSTIKIDGQDYTIKPGDTLDRIAKKMKPSVQAVSPEPASAQGSAQGFDDFRKLIDVAAGMPRSATADAEPKAPASSEIKKAMRNFERQQVIDNLVKQADSMTSVPAPKTAEELAQDELWKDIRAHAAGRSSEEISAAAKQAMQELEAKIAADQLASTITKSASDPTELPGIELKGSTEPYTPPIDVPIDSKEQARRQAQKDAASDELKEAINTESHALHEILRLAGRIK